MTGAGRAAHETEARRRGERGSAAVELTLLAPVLIGILLFVVGLGRMAHASQQVESVSADAARAASLERSPSASTGVAQRAARASLDQAGLSCASMDVGVDVSGYQPGGSVAVTVTCTADLSGLVMAGFPGTRTFTSSTTVPIEEWRAKAAAHKNAAHKNVVTLAAHRVLDRRRRDDGGTHAQERRRDERGRGERGRDDWGAATVFVVLLAVALLTAGGLVIDGGYALAARRATVAQAEQAARVAATKLNETDLRSGRSVVANAQAQAAAQTYLSNAGAAGTVTIAGDQVTVTVRKDYQPAILSMVGIGSLDVGATATAVSIDDDDL